MKSVTVWEGPPLPLPLSDIKEHLRIFHNRDDSLLMHFIEVGREYIERFTQSPLKEQEVLMTFTEDCSPFIEKGPILQLLEFKIHQNNQVLEGNSNYIRDRKIVIPFSFKKALLRAKIGTRHLTPLVKHVWIAIVTELYTQENLNPTKIQSFLQPLRQSLSV